MRQHPLRSALVALAILFAAAGAVHAADLSIAAVRGGDVLDLE